MNKDKNITINISTLTILKILLIFLILTFLYLIREVVALIFVSLILASALDPWVDWLYKKKIPRGFSILAIYLVIFSVIGLAIYLVIPPVANEIKDISQNFPVYYEKVVQAYERFKDIGDFRGSTQVQETLGTIGNNVAEAAGSLVNSVFNIFGGIVSFFLILVITFYFTVQEEGLKRFFRSITPTKHQPYVSQLIVRMQRRMGLWLRGQLILSLVIFVLVFTGLTILGVKYALLLAFLAGVLEIIPFLGPTLSAIPAIFLTLSHSPLKALFVAILYFVIQQLENQIIVPKIMGKSVDLNPLIVIIVILMGVKLGGFVGALLAVPVATAISVFLKDVFQAKEQNELS